jgi:hypothetical protein
MVVTPAMGAGTTVDLWVGRAMDDASLNRVEETSDRPARSGAARRMLVDDDDLVRETLVEQMEDPGFKTNMALSGSEALALIESGVALDALMSDRCLAWAVWRRPASPCSAAGNAVLPVDRLCRRTGRPGGWGHVHFGAQADLGQKAGGADRGKSRSCGDRQREAANLGRKPDDYRVCRGASTACSWRRPA